MFCAMTHNQFLCRPYFAESRTDIALTQRVCRSTVGCAREKQTASGGPCKLEENVLFTSIAAFQVPRPCLFVPVKISYFG